MRGLLAAGAAADRRGGWCWGCGLQDVGSNRWGGGSWLAG